ncbi:MAG: MFS transporter [Gammaproteobacteria bacterium]|nr:MFS transporter [Gammaproteobacteria bacterium]
MENVSENLPLTKKTEMIGWVICSLGAVFYCYEYLLRIQPSVIVNELMRQFHISSLDKFSAIISLYYLAYTPMQAVVGVMTDLYGPRFILTFAVFMCTLGSFFFGIADNVFLASIGRFLVGFGSAFAFVSALKLASIWLPLNRFALFAGLVTALGMMGGMAGDIGLTHLVTSVGWKQTLYGSTFLGVILLPILWFAIRDKKSSLSTPRSESKASYKETLAGLYRILSNPQVWIAGFIGCILYMSLSVFAELWGIPFLKTVYHLDAQQAAFTNSMVFFGWLVGAPLTGWISDKMQKRRLPLLLGCLFSALAITWVIYIPTSLILAQILLFLFGVFSSIEVVCFAVGRETSPRNVSGAAVSFVNLLVMFGGLAFQPLVGKILDIYWKGLISDDLRVYTPEGFRLALTVIPVAIIIGMVLCFILRESFDKSLDSQ